MAIEDQIEQLESGIESSYEKVEAKGGTIPAHKNVDNLAGAIDSITIPPEPTGTLNITANGDYDVKSKASAHVDVPSGITPTGTISITDNGQVDVTQYATADVNVSGGGGGIPDQDIDVVSTTAVPSSFQTSMSMSADGDILKLFVEPQNSSHLFSRQGQNRYAETAKYLGNDGLFHCPLTINGQTLDFTSYAAFTSTNYPNSSLNTLTVSSTDKIQGSSCVCEFDFDNAIEWTVGETTQLVQDNTVVATGKLYVVPYKPVSPALAAKGIYKKFPNTSVTMIGTESLAHKVNSTASPQSWSILTRIPARDATGSDNKISVPTNYQGIPTDIINQTDYITGPFATDVALPDAFGYNAVFIKTGKTLEDAKADFVTDGTILSDSYLSKYYMDGGVEKQITQDDTGTPQSQELKDAWASIVASKPSTLSISVPTGDTSGNKFAACLQTKNVVKLSDIVGSLKVVTLNYFDYNTYSTTKHPLAIMQVDDFDISGITQLYNQGGYY